MSLHAHEESVSIQFKLYLHTNKTVIFKVLLTETNSTDVECLWYIVFCVHVCVALHKKYSSNLYRSVSV